MTTEEQIRSLREELREHNYNYYVLDQPTIDAFEFDICPAGILRSCAVHERVDDDQCGPFHHFRRATNSFFCGQGSSSTTSQRSTIVIFNHD